MMGSTAGWLRRAIHMLRRSIAVRLALMFAIAELGGFALIGTALVQVLDHQLLRHQQEEVESRIAGMRYLLERGRSPQLASRVREKIDTLAETDRETRYWLWSESPDFLYGTDLPLVLEATRRQPLGMVSLPLGPEGRPMVVMGVDLPANERRPAVRLMAGIDSLSFAHTLHTFKSALWAFTGISVLLVAALGYWIARVGLRPVQRLSTQAQSIGPGNRGQRLQSPALPLELANMGASFDAALDRLDAAYHQLETFNADVAHELRTPLANLIGQTQVALARERGAQRLHEVLQSNLEELERLRAIVSDMLFLARAEQGARANRLVDASLAAEVAKTVDFFDVLLDEASMRITVEGDAVAPIETSLFRRALTNLLQ
ncbi:MAG TPA: histidine kinase dimerization/phospho-acceptor domain-containing protein, partial [Burkholderiaceae bacterium]